MSPGNLAFYFTPFFAGQDRPNMTKFTFMRRVLFSLVGIFGFSFCLTCVYLAMRGIMKLGGFVASGGPYHIAHQAPDWVWILPVSIVTSVIFIFLNQFNAKRVGGINLITMLFPAVFLTLGWNFLEFGLHPPNNQPGYAWGWLICAGCFILMGGIPMLFLLKNVFKVFTGEIYVNQKKDFSKYYTDKPPDQQNNFMGGKITLLIILLMNFVTIAAAIYLGIGYFLKLIK